MKIYVTVNGAFYTKKEAQQRRPGTEIHEVDLTRPVFLVSIQSVGDSKPPQPFEVFKTLTEADKYRVPTVSNFIYYITEIRGY